MWTETVELTSMVQIIKMYYLPIQRLRKYCSAVLNMLYTLIEFVRALGEPDLAEEDEEEEAEDLEDVYQ